MVRICILGYGKMGRVIEEEIGKAKDAKVALIVDHSENAPGVIRPDALKSKLKDFDVLIDFSSAASNPLLVECAKAGKRLVVGTTARTEEQDNALAAAVKAGKSSAIVASNYSIGMNALFCLLKKADALLPDYDRGIVEVHHTQKKDAPSGTAKTLAKIIALDPSKVQSLRIGEVFGDHEVHFAANSEQLTLKHVACSRKCFANGAVRSALWLANNKPDGKVHTFREVLGFE